MNEPILIMNTESFNEILSGHKKHEYRDPSKFYKRMFCVKEGNYHTDLIDRIFKKRKKNLIFKPIKAVWLALGYRKDRKMMKVEVKDIHIDKFKSNAPENFRRGDVSFVLDLGSILEKKNF